MKENLSPLQNQASHSSHDFQKKLNPLWNQASHSSHNFQWKKPCRLFRICALMSQPLPTHGSAMAVTWVQISPMSVTKSFWLQIAFVTAIGDISSNSPMTVRWELASSQTFCHSHYRYFQKRAKNCQKRIVTKGCHIHTNYNALFYYSHNWPFS